MAIPQTTYAGPALSEAQALDWAARIAQELEASAFDPVQVSNGDVRAIEVWESVRLQRNPVTGLIEASSRRAGTLQSDPKVLRAFGPMAIRDRSWRDAFAQRAFRARVPLYGPASEQGISALEDALDRLALRPAPGARWRHLLLGLLDPQIARWTRLAFGPFYSLDAYNELVKERECAGQLAERQPQLLPVFAWLLLLRKAGRWAWFASEIARDAEANVQAVLDNLRRHLVRFHIGEFVVFSPAGWRTLLRLSPTQTRSLFAHNGGRSDTSIAALASLLPFALPAAMATAGVKRVHVRLLREIIAHQTPSLRQAELSKVMRLAQKRIDELLASGQKLREFFSGELELVLSYVFASGSPLEIDRNSTWNTLMRGQARWHQEMLWFARPIDPSLTWESRLTRQIIDGCTATPLTSAAALMAEGEEMNHCVGSYALYAAGGDVEILSLSSPWGRSTLELQCRHSHWSVAQIRGVANGTPPKGHEDVAARLAIQLDEKTL